MAMNLDQNNGGDDIVAEINMTPLIDVMLVLLIIFMVTSTAMVESALNIDLPKASNITSPKPVENVVVMVDKHGKIALQGREIKFADFAKEVTKEMELKKSQAVVFEGDTEVQMGKMVALMDLAKKSGAKSFSIAAEQVDENKGKEK